ncbi:hypothetical protein DWV00_04030 [Trinickia dinghuensis]|uniref:Uncharacterized protein n=1 Tax=Trinickia dinghuensis TaxID=2291023 RepID=A0A3D8K5N5_9BURK|nr:hypothetical protein DWV00_04030 [Trinickia dinghuensis]
MISAAASSDRSWPNDLAAYRYRYIIADDLFAETQSNEQIKPPLLDFRKHFLCLVHSEKSIVDHPSSLLSGSRRDL